MLLLVRITYILDNPGQLPLYILPLQQCGTVQAKSHIEHPPLPSAPLQGSMACQRTPESTK